MTSNPAAAPVSVHPTSSKLSVDGIVDWRAPDGDHPARAAAVRSYVGAASGSFEEWMAGYAEDAVVMDPVGPSMFDATGAGHHGREGIRKFWEATIATLDSMHFTITDSHAHANHCANVMQIRTGFADGGSVTTDLIAIYEVNDDGLITSMKAYWEPDRAMATYTKG